MALALALFSICLTTKLAFILLRVIATDNSGYHAVIISEMLSYRTNLILLQLFVCEQIILSVQ